MENLQKRKKEIINQIPEDRLKKLKFSKLLKLIIFEIEELMVYWTVRQVNKMVCEVFDINISEPLFYRFCLKNLKKDEISKPIKRDKIEEGVSQNRDTKKEEIATLNEEELSAIAMFNSKID